MFIHRSTALWLMVTNQPLGDSVIHLIFIVKQLFLIQNIDLNIGSIFI